ncbi:hypothetical protein BOSP111201_25305 [Bordetella sputigena]|uniref:hypothetical protein n=1 Tax=Bordetella sputigena TaxID=1416810 RepID=UPI0039EE9550
MKPQFPDDGHKVAIYATANGKYLKLPNGEGQVIANGASPQDPACVFVWQNDGILRSQSDPAIYLGYQPGIPLLYAGASDTSVPFSGELLAPTDQPPAGYAMVVQVISGDFGNRFWQCAKSLGGAISLTEHNPGTPPFGDPCLFVWIDAS